MVVVMRLLIFLLLASALSTLSGCSSSIEQRIENFYLKNKDNPKLLMFENVFIIPARNMYEIELSNSHVIRFRVLKYDESQQPHLVLQNSGDALQQLGEEYDLEPRAAMEYLTELFSAYRELEVLAVFGRGLPNSTYIKFVIDPSHVVVYVPDRSNLAERTLNEIAELESNAVMRFDDNWFVYKPDKPFDFGG